MGRGSRAENDRVHREVQASRWLFDSFGIAYNELQAAIDKGLDRVRPSWTETQGGVHGRSRQPEPACRTPMSPPKKAARGPAPSLRPFGVYCTYLFFIL
ncbi:hypothetical protein Y032_0100g3237 [Ancylostoma ceylanicum]|uniref:Uncharacterized protein n=1 Tax=Ancylostoma ceylanicum TaxID=53326 RepID=A0A016TH71_9BILA|nr:hypothetical protein Y032_0100g3237 [Ancylostoma ceylanicum]